MSDEPYDPKKAIAELVAGQPNRAARKLTFFDQCAAFFALYNGVSTNIVAKTFGISPTATSQIAGCLESDPNPYRRRLAFEDGQPVVETFHRDHNRNRWADRKRRYPRVAAEFVRLGEQAFGEKYFPEFMRQRLMEAKYGLATRPAGGRPGPRGPDPNDNDYPGPFELFGDSFDMQWLEEPPPAGWYVIVTNHNTTFGRERLEGGERRPFQSRLHAWRAPYRDFGEEPPPYKKSK